MSTFNSTTILSKGTAEYSRHYGGFRGVDFSNDHTQISQTRLAYSVNMYKDYQSGQGEALETVAGFRRRAEFINLPSIIDGVVKDVKSLPAADIYGIFYYKHKFENTILTKVIVHSGNNLWLWHNYPNTINIRKMETITVPNPLSTETIGNTVIHTYVQKLDFIASAIISLNTEHGESLLSSVVFDNKTNTIKYLSSVVITNQRLIIEYYEGVIDSSAIPLFSTMNNHPSESFVFNNKLYIIDGKNYIVYDGFSVVNVRDDAYVPTTWISLRPDGSTAANVAKEYEQRNIMSPKFKNTFIADGTSKVFSLTENEITLIASVKVYGVEKTANIDYTVDLANGKITFTMAPADPSSTVQIAATQNAVAVMYGDGYAGVEITALKPYTSLDGVTISESDISELITKCTLATTYDGRVFVSGNPNYRNYLFYCGRNDTGYTDPSYFGILNYQQDGVGLSSITGIMCVADTLMVLKSDTQQDSSVYFHYGADSSINLLPRIYPSKQGMSGLGCVGACCNYIDDPVFISRLGVEGIAKQQLNSERAIEHRSSLVDAKLVNNNLSEATMAEWGGYLCVLIDGKLFLADSRQKFADDTGIMQYEWYFIDGIGVYDSQYTEYYYSNLMPDELKGARIIHNVNGIETLIPLEIANNVCYSYEGVLKNLSGTIANEPDADGMATKTIFNQQVIVTIASTDYMIGVYYAIHEVYDIYTNRIVERHAYLCESKGNYTGGKFEKARSLGVMDDNLFFGTVNGVVCSFNFDMRDSVGEIPSRYYSFDGRTIFSGCATLMDNCGIPHLTKTTIKRSTVIKTKAFKNSVAKVKVRTNISPYAQIARINNSLFTFEDTDFTDFTFNTNEQSIFAIREKEKHWVEKQFFIFSDEFLKPFSLYSISFRYKIAGRIK